MTDEGQSNPLRDIREIKPMSRIPTACFLSAGASLKTEGTFSEHLPLSVHGGTRKISERHESAFGNCQHLNPAICFCKQIKLCNFASMQP